MNQVQPKKPGGTGSAFSDKLDGLWVMDYQPKGGMCATCKHIFDNCRNLDFSKMKKQILQVWLNGIGAGLQIQFISNA
jgi:hypothetical protein